MKSTNLFPLACRIALCGTLFAAISGGGQDVWQRLKAYLSRVLGS